jgi:hypothetical protein
MLQGNRLVEGKRKRKRDDTRIAAAGPSRRPPASFSPLTSCPMCSAPFYSFQRTGSCGVLSSWTMARSATFEPWGLTTATLFGPRSWQPASSIFGSCANQIKKKEKKRRGESKKEPIVRFVRPSFSPSSWLHPFLPFSSLPLFSLSFFLLFLSSFLSGFAGAAATA